MSGEAALVALLLFMIFPPMITQFLFAILPGWTMKTLVSRNLPGFIYTICITSAVAALDCIMGGLNFFLSLYISVRFRRRLTYHMHDRYLSTKQFYYRMTLSANNVDNPDQRIQNDSAQVPTSAGTQRGESRMTEGLRHRLIHPLSPPWTHPRPSLQSLRPPPAPNLDTCAAAAAAAAPPPAGDGGAGDDPVHHRQRHAAGAWAGP